MNKQKFLNLINDHQNVSDKDLDSLESLVSEYPYCQIGHILLSDIYSQTGSGKADDKLHLTAVYATDRTLLKHMLLGTDLKEPPSQAAIAEVEVIEKEVAHVDEISEVEEELTVEAEKPLVESIEAKAVEVAETKEVEKEQVPEAVEEVALEAEAESTEVESIEDLLVNPSTEEPSLTLDKIGEEEEEDSIYKELEKNLKALRERKSPSVKDNITSNAPEILAKSSKSTPAKKIKAKTTKVAETKAKKTTPKSKISKAKKPVVAKSDVKKSPAVKKASAKRTTPKAAVKSSKRAASKKAPIKKTITKKVVTKKVSKSKSVAATAIKKAKAQAKKTVAKKKPAKPSAKKVESKKAAPVKKKPQAKVSDRSNSKIITNLLKKKEKKVKNKAVLDQNQIIDKFIKDEPSISRVNMKDSFDMKRQEDLAVGSVKKGDDLISENLATIMVNQGKKSKAIDIYKKLIWKNPQKKAYFAAQIEKLKK